MLGLSQRLTDQQARPVTLAALAGIANAAGGSAGASVTVSIASFTDTLGNGTLPANGAYAVQVEASQACFTAISAKTTSGFTVTLQPVTTGTTLAAGTIDVVIVG